MNNTIIIAKMRGLFLNGGKYTAKQLNSLAGTNDARKAVSVLRANGMIIRDVRLVDNSKLYWYVSNENQLSLFQEGGCNE